MIDHFSVAVVGNDERARFSGAFDCPSERGDAGLFDAHPGQAIRVSEVTWLLPRPARLRIGGRKILSLGGAASVDREWRVPGVSWWPDEVITD